VHKVLKVFKDQQALKAPLALKEQLVHKVYKELKVL
jgi:hypothetical protein